MEQPYVLNRDDRLIGKGFKQLDLALREGPEIGAANADNAERDAFAQQRRGEAGLMAGAGLSGNSLIESLRLWMWIVCRSIIARPVTVPRLTGRSALAANSP